jgi:hypothetical protein
VGPGLDSLNPYDRLQVHQDVRRSIPPTQILERVTAATPAAVEEAALEQLERVEEEIADSRGWGPDQGDRLHLIRCYHERRHRLRQYLPDAPAAEESAGAYYSHHLEARIATLKPSQLTGLVPELERQVGRLDRRRQDTLLPMGIRRRADEVHGRFRDALLRAPVAISAICDAAAEALGAIAAATTRDHPAAHDYRRASAELEQARQVREFTGADDVADARIPLLEARRDHAREAAARDVARHVEQLRARLEQGSMSAVGEILADVERDPHAYPDGAGPALRRRIAALLADPDPLPWCGTSRAFEPEPVPADQIEPSWS